MHNLGGRMDAVLITNQAIRIRYRVCLRLIKTICDVRAPFLSAFVGELAMQVFLGVGMPSRIISFDLKE